MANAPGYDYVASTGIIIPDTGQILDDVQQEYRDAFGQDLVVTSDTKQGVLISTEVTARSNFAKTNGDVANQINPDIAGGVFLDAIAALFGLDRPPATYGVIRAALLGGRPSTIIPRRSRGRDENGNIWRTVKDVQLDGTGAATVDFQCDVPGPIVCAPNTLNRVADDVLGWEEVTNPNAAVPGTDEMSDEDFRGLRNRTLAKQGRASAEAQISDLYMIPEVQSVAYRENIANTNQVIDGIAMGPHSVWACVNGGADTDIALSLLNNKTDGAGWNGAITISVREPYSGQVYDVQFDRPVQRAVLARVTVRQVGSSVADPTTVVPQAIVDYANGKVPGQRGFVVGGSVSPFELSAAINYFYPSIYVAKLEVAFASGTPVYQTNELILALNEIPTILLGSVQVIVL